MTRRNPIKEQSLIWEIKKANDTAVKAQAKTDKAMGNLQYYLELLAKDYPETFKQIYAQEITEVVQPNTENNPTELTSK